MKKIQLIFAILFLASYSSFSQVVRDQNVKSEITSATIYLTGAEVVHNPTINLQAGRTKLIFSDISHKINPKSIRVTTKTGIDILSVTSKINYLTKVEEQSVVKKVRDSLKLVSQRTQVLQDERDAYTIEKDMLLKNTSIAGVNTGVPIAELQKAADFYRTRIKEINTKLSSINTELTEISLTTQRLYNELNELNASLNYMRAEIEILVSSNTAVSTGFELKYVVTDAGWAPSYDIKATDTDKPVELVYRAKVFNNTGIDWKDLDIKLSTADPTLDVSQPVLMPWYLTQYSRTSQYKGEFQQSEGYMQNMVVSDELESTSEYGRGLDTGSPTTTFVTEAFESAAVPELSAEFVINTKYSVPSDDKPYLVDVNTHELPATYKHFAVTKLDKDVFLLARITGWEDLNLVEGPANVYYSGTYLGQSFINTRDVKDTLDLSLGRDSKVLVTRSKLKEFSSTQFIGSKRKETFTYEFVVKNNRKSKITIDVLDQLPISQSDEIEVSAIEISDAKQDLSTGELKWNYTVEPGESKKIRLSFYIKYPQTMELEVNKMKSKSVRKF